MSEKENKIQATEGEVPESETKTESRREFFSSLGKWSKVVIATVVLGEAIGTNESSAWSNGGWHNGGWHNGGWKNGGWKNGGWKNGGWHNGGWHNGGWWNGGWKNKWNNGGWYNSGWYNWYSK